MTTTSLNNPEVPSTLSITTIPRGIVGETFSFLDVKSLGRIEQVCNEFHDATNPAWTTIATQLMLLTSPIYNVVVGGHADDCDDTCNSRRRNSKELVRRYCAVSGYTRSMQRNYSFDRKNLPNLKTGVFLKQNIHQYSFFVRLDAIPMHAVLINQFVSTVETLPPPSTTSTKYLSYRLHLKDSIDTDQWEIVKENFTHPRQRKLYVLLRLLKCLSITITAIHKQTGQCSLILTTCGGTTWSTTTTTIQENECIHWDFLPRLADSNPNPVSLSNFIIPKVKASLKISADYSTMETLDIQVL